MVSDHSHQSHGSANANTLSAPSDLVQLGHVSGAYGIKGWLRIQAYSEHADTLLQCKNWWLQSPAAHHSAGDLLSASPTNPQHHRIQTVREQGKQLVAQVEIGRASCRGRGSGAEVGGGVRDEGSR